jgi:hypothetical protein
MEIFNLIARLRGDARIAELAEEIANRAADGVRERVSLRLGALSVAEARGYVRARSAAVVRPMVDALIAGDSGIKSVWRSQLVEKATVEVSRRLLWEEMARRRDSAPLRRAA